MEKFIEYIENKDYNGLKQHWLREKGNYTDCDKQKLLYNIFLSFYKDKEYAFFRKLLKLFTDDKVNLNFSTDDYYCTLLSLAISMPSKILFNLFLEHGAKINFVGDKFAFENEESIKKELESGTERYFTCMDFANEIWGDYFILFHHWRPDIDKYSSEQSIAIDDKEMVTLPLRELVYYMEQANELHDIIITGEIIDELERNGAKRYDTMTAAERKRNMSKKMA